MDSPIPVGVHAGALSQQTQTREYIVPILFVFGGIIRCLYYKPARWVRLVKGNTRSPSKGERIFALLHHKLERCTLIDKYTVYISVNY